MYVRMRDNMLCLPFLSSSPSSFSSRGLCYFYSRYTLSHEWFAKPVARFNFGILVALSPRGRMVFFVVQFTYRVCQIIPALLLSNINPLIARVIVSSSHYVDDFMYQLSSLDIYLGSLHKDKHKSNIYIYFFCIKSDITRIFYTIKLIINIY